MIPDWVLLQDHWTSSAMLPVWNLRILVTWHGKDLGEMSNETRSCTNICSCTLSTLGGWLHYTKPCPSSVGLACWLINIVQPSEIVQFTMNNGERQNDYKARENRNVSILRRSTKRILDVKRILDLERILDNIILQLSVSRTGLFIFLTISSFNIAVSESNARATEELRSKERDILPIKCLQRILDWKRILEQLILWASAFNYELIISGNRRCIHVHDWP